MSKLLVKLIAARERIMAGKQPIISVRDLVKNYVSGA